MKKFFNFVVALVTILLILSITIMSSGCSQSGTSQTTTATSNQTTSAAVTTTPTTSQPEGFAIYLTQNNIPPSQMAALSHVDIADAPIIGINDIVTYNSANHEITLTAEAFKRITSLGVSTTGKSFVVCVNKSPIYWGAFWTPISSQSFDGITILLPLGAQPMDTITIGLGYPGPSFFPGEDPRNNPTIMTSLQNAGKLINKIDYLPASFKGYELYSWLNYGDWNYTLITGTNRNKTIEEIIFGDGPGAGDGWVNIRAVGLTAIKEVLVRVPPNEQVIWWPGPVSEEFPTKFELPPPADVDAIKAIAVQGGWTLNIVN